MSEEQVPQLRLENHCEPWGERAFGELAQRKVRTTADNSLPQVEYEDIDSGFGSLNNDLDHKTTRKSGIAFQSGDVLFGKLRPYLRNWLLAEFPGIAIGDFWVLQGNHCDPAFLYNLIQGTKFTAVSNISSGSKMPRSDWDLVSQTTFMTPNSLQEQRAIGCLFSQLDSSISQHRRHHQKLQQTKTALLQQLFPQDGADLPELRFEGFTTPWISQRLSEFDIKTGPFGSALHASDYVHEGTPIVTTEHFKTGMLPANGSGIPQVSESDTLRLSSYQLLQGDIVFSRVGSVDLNALVTTDQVGWLFSGRVLRVRTYGMCDSAYLHYALDTDPVRQSILTRAVGQTMPSINTKILGDTTVSMPESREEQRTIGAFLSRLDSLIATKQLYIDKLQQVKSGLLQNMFI